MMEVRAEGKWVENGMSEIAGAVIAWNMESGQTRIIIEEAAIGWPRGRERVRISKKNKFGSDNTVVACRAQKCIGL